MESRKDILMNTDLYTETFTRAAQDRILSLLVDLPPDGLAAAEQFVQLLRKYVAAPAATKSGRISYHYPTILLPASSLDAWVNLTETGYPGDALADTEAIYDEV
jgi:hypothetical protein